MHKFTDEAGQEWKINLNVGIIDDISDELGIDLFEPIGAENSEDQVISKLAPISGENIRRFANMLFMICEDQCKEREMESKQFGKMLRGDAFKLASEAFYLEWVDFFQSLGRTDLIEAIKKVMEVIQEGLTEVAKRIKETTKEDLKTISKTGSKTSETGN